jgi:[acyl-carrier-protein] S-malonyltransferase
VKTLAMFPGQGSQTIGMGKALLDNHPYLSKTFEEAEDAAKIPVRRYCFEGPEDQLKLTAITQPAIVTVSIASWRMQVEEHGRTADAFAGHSLGEYAALVAAARLSFFDAIKLVRSRGLAMQKAVPEGVGAMSAILGCDATLLEALCQQISSPTKSVEVVNYNSPQQLVVAGHASAVDDLEKLLTEKGLKFIRLQVSAPFHSNLMAPARAEMSPLLEATKLLENNTCMIPNLTGTPVNSYTVQNLIEQIDRPVRWIQTIQSASQMGIESYFEVGPGRVLCGLAKRILPKGTWTIDATNV